MGLAHSPTIALRSEKGYEKYAWLTFLPGVVFFLAIGLGQVLSPGTVDPTAPPTDVRLSGLGLIGLMLFGSAIITGGFRAGKRWAWYSLWYYPVFFVSIFVINISDAYWTTNSSLFLILSLAGLLLAYRKFFPREA